MGSRKIAAIINLLASSCAGAPALKYGDVNTVTPSPGEVKGLSKNLITFWLLTLWPR